MEKRGGTGFPLSFFRAFLLKVKRSEKTYHAQPEDDYRI
jgi:hypothetical protein